jgi:hypothetical protein
MSAGNLGIPTSLRFRWDRDTIEDTLSGVLQREHNRSQSFEVQQITNKS